jgi:hypothetical protein
MSGPTPDGKSSQKQGKIPGAFNLPSIDVRLPTDACA